MKKILVSHLERFRLYSNPSQPLCNSIQKKLICLVGSCLLFTFLSQVKAQGALPLEPQQALLKTAAPSEKQGRLFWPTSTPVPVLQSFKAPKAKWLPGRRGVELQYREAAPIYAAAAGKVYYVGEINHLPTISILHKNGLRSTYLPVKSDLKRGNKITRGQIIGQLQSPEKNGRLKFGLKLDDSHYFNPMPYLYGPIVLLESDIPSK